MTQPILGGRFWEASVLLWLLTVLTPTHVLLTLCTTCRHISVPISPHTPPPYIKVRSLSVLLIYIFQFLPSIVKVLYCLTIIFPTPHHSSLLRSLYDYNLLSRGFFALLRNSHNFLPSSFFS